MGAEFRFDEFNQYLLKTILLQGSFKRYRAELSKGLCHGQAQPWLSKVCCNTGEMKCYQRQLP